MADRDSAVEELREVQEDSYACPTNFKVTDPPIAGVRQKNTDVTHCLVAQDLRLGAASIRPKRDWFTQRAASGQGQFLVP